jgi:hypothetical protein
MDVYYKTIISYLETRGTLYISAIMTDANIFYQNTVNVMITIFKDFFQFYETNVRFSQNQCYDHFFCKISCR